ncbi:MAG TPA: choice-of-anchor Q domain-containing protein [Actinomycetota bacterium]|nr:choice-of-anchor Q domain-containing protein [Actinomycetota bacterium]
MSVRCAVRAFVVSALALATVPALVPGVAHATTTAVDCGANPAALQSVITAATAGDTLNVTGHCIGNLTIDKNLTLQGDGSTVLDGNGTGRSLDIPGSPTVDLSDLTVTGGNNADGGGISIRSPSGGPAHVTLTRVTVSGNTASGGLADGGGIHNASGALTMLDSTVMGNTATARIAEGGGIFNGGTLTLVDSTVSGNTATGDINARGGGIASPQSGGQPDITLINSTISGNSAMGTGTVGSGRGGGIWAEIGTLSMRSSTVGGNSATGAVASAGGIWAPGIYVYATATIISGNTGSQAGFSGPDCFADLASGRYNLVGDTTGCTGLDATDIQNVNAMLDTLKNNGGLTQTMSLLPGSPALDAIPLIGGVCLVGQPTDQRGVARPQGPRCDVGAVEVRQGSTTATTTTVGSSDTSATLGQAVTFIATVCTTLPATPTGTVTFRDGGSGPILASALSLVSGGGTHCAQSIFTTSSLAAGRHKIVAIYSGDGVNTKSRGSVIQRVKA